MLDFIQTLLDTFPEGAVQLREGAVVFANPMARHYLPQLEPGRPCPGFITLPHTGPSGAGIFTAGPASYTYSCTAGPEEQTVLFRPAPQTALTSRQLEGVLSQLRALHGKSSHQEALESAARLWDLLEQAPWEIPHQVFQADVLGHSSLKGQNFQADVIFADVPYGNLVAWQGQSGEPANLLDQLLPVTREGSVVAICSDKSQKFHSQHFQRMEKQQAGKRLFQIFTVLPKSGREAG